MSFFFPFFSLDNYKYVLSACIKALLYRTSVLFSFFHSQKIKIKYRTPTSFNYEKHIWPTCLHITQCKINSVRSALNYYVIREWNLMTWHNVHTLVSCFSCRKFSFSEIRSENTVTTLQRKFFLIEIDQLIFNMIWNYIDDQLIIEPD